MKKITFSKFQITNPNHVPFTVANGIPCVSEHFITQLRNDGYTKDNIESLIIVEENDAVALSMFNRLKERLS